MKVIDAYWYTPTFPGADPFTHSMLGLIDIVIAFIAIDIGHDKWKCYMGWHIGGDDFDAEVAAMRTARSGAKVTKEVACAHFPNLKPEDFTY